MNIVEIIKDSWQEYHPYQSLVLFSFGCNLKCPRCYNLEQITNKKNVIGEAIPLMKKHLNPMHEAVVFLGGEPTIWGDKLIDAVSFAKEKGLKTKIYSNGMFPKMVKELLEIDVVDSWSIDIKTIEENIYSVMGVSLYLKQYLMNVLTSIDQIQKSRAEIELRTTAWKEVNVWKVKEYVKYYFPDINHIIAKDFLE